MSGPAVRLDSEGAPVETRQRFHELRRVWFAAALVAAHFMLAAGCRPPQSPSMVSLRMKGNVANAQVTIDDQMVGPLGYVAAKGVALPAGPHRITVERPGYFPWDKLVEAQAAPIELDVRLVPIPDGG